MTRTTPHSTDKGMGIALRASSSRRELALLICAMVAGPLFFAISSIAGGLRPDYDPRRHPVSALEFGPQGWVHAVNFLLTGTLVVFFGWGVRSTVRRLGGGSAVPILLIIVGIGLFGAGLFDPDPLSGYPPGTPPTAPDPSLHRVLHDLFSTPVFTLLPSAGIVLARRFGRSGQTSWAIYSALSAAMMVIFFVLASIAFGRGTALVPFGGLFQRLTLAAGFGWLALLGWWAIRNQSYRCPAGLPPATTRVETARPTRRWRVDAREEVRDRRCSTSGRWGHSFSGSHRAGRAVHPYAVSPGSPPGSQQPTAVRSGGCTGVGSVKRTL